MKSNYKEAAEKYAREHSKAPDKETPDWIINDFLAGCEHAYTLGRKEQREEDLKERRELLCTIREFMKVCHFTNAAELSRFWELEAEIKKALAAFTEEEQKSLPFE